MRTQNQDLAVLLLLKVRIIWYISEIPMWMKAKDTKVSNKQSTLRFTYEYLLIFPIGRLSLGFIPLY